jgi:2-keto-4-pentenoate hydratase/2-oxohepta-3-ene-1,7-dioic acid hydratase in catechol pathway
MKLLRWGAVGSARPVKLNTKGVAHDLTRPWGPADTIPFPRGSETPQRGEELVIGVGSRAKYVDEAGAAAHVAGCTVGNGSPPCVGMGMTPPRYLEPGDVVEPGTEGLGTKRQEVVADG